MRAVVFEGPRQVRVVDDAPVPRPGEGEVLLRCTHAGLCGSDIGPYLGVGRWAAWQWPSPPGRGGHENVGVVAESSLSEWPAGTAVVAQGRGFNGYAEYIAAAPNAMARLPDGVEDPGAYILAQPMATVLRALAKTEPVIDQCCAVVGQGPIGLMFTYLLRRMGARRVIGIDLVPWRLEWSRRLGATDVVDASTADTRTAVADLTGGRLVDLAVEAATTPEALQTAAMLPCYGGRLQVFGVPRYDPQPFPWAHTLYNETRVLTSHGPGLLRYMPQAVELLAGDCADLRALCTPRVPFGQAPRAFEDYAEPARAPGTLKAILEL